MQNVRRTRAIVRWATRQAGEGIVEYWDDSRVVRSTAAQMKYFDPQETGSGFEHYRFEAQLSKLDPGTFYNYRVLMDGSPMLPDATAFQTPGTQPFEFLAFGDSGTGSEAQGHIAARLLEHKAQFVVHTGDLVYPAGSYERYDSLYFAYYKDLMQQAPFFPCPGNHDYYDTGFIPYRAVHAFPEETVPVADRGRYYSFDWGNAHIVSLDTNDAFGEAIAGTGEMLRWLDRDLASTTRFWRVVVMHHAAYAAGKHSEEPEAGLVRQYITPILDKYAVSLVLNGHEHSYQRSVPIRSGVATPAGQGTVFVTTGGGGADLHPVYASDQIVKSASEFHYVTCGVNGSRLQLKAIRADGTELDSFLIAPQPTLSTSGVLDSASFGAGLACGGLATIFGHHLAPEEVVPTEYPLPRSAAGTAVYLNGQQLPVLMMSASQINVQLPFDVVGEATLKVQTANGAASQQVTIGSTAPAIFTDTVFHADGSKVSADAPARQGEMLTVYLTGLGAVRGTVRPGEPSPALQADCAVKVELGSTQIDPEFAGLAAGIAGVNVVRFAVPAGTAREVALRVVAAGRRSNAIGLPVV